MAEPNKRQSFLSLIRPVWPATGELLLLSLFVNLLALAVPVFVLQVYDRVVAKGGLTTLQGLAIGMGLVLLFDFLLRQTRSRVVQRASLRFDLVFGAKLFEKLGRMPLRVLEARPASFWQGLFRDSDMVRNAVAGPPVIMLIDLPFAVLFIIIIYVIAPPLVWVILTAAVVFILFALRTWRCCHMGRTASSSDRALMVVRLAMMSARNASRFRDVPRSTWVTLLMATPDRSAKRINTTAAVRMTP